MSGGRRRAEERWRKTTEIPLWSGKMSMINGNVPGNAARYITTRAPRTATPTVRRGFYHRPPQVMPGESSPTITAKNISTNTSPGAAVQNAAGVLPNPRYTPCMSIDESRRSCARSRIRARRKASRGQVCDACSARSQEPQTPAPWVETAENRIGKARKKSLKGTFFVLTSPAINRRRYRRRCRGRRHSPPSFRDYLSCHHHRISPSCSWHSD